MVAVMVVVVMVVVLLMWLCKFSRALSEFWRPRIQGRPGQARAGQSQALLLTLSLTAVLRLHRAPCSLCLRHLLPLGVSTLCLMLLHV